MSAFLVLQNFTICFIQPRRPSRRYRNVDSSYFNMKYRVRANLIIEEKLFIMQVGNMYTRETIIKVMY